MLVQDSSTIILLAALSMHCKTLCKIYSSQVKPSLPTLVNLGSSLFHACNMYLVLNPLMESISPQFHVSFNDYFKTIRYNPYGTDMLITWQQFAGLMQVLDIKPEPMIETTAIAISSTQDCPSEKDQIFFSEEVKKERESIANSNHPILHSQ